MPQRIVRCSGIKSCPLSTIEPDSLTCIQELLATLQAKAALNNASAHVDLANMPVPYRYSPRSVSSTPCTLFRGFASTALTLLRLRMRSA